jgi:hypothetical protein
MTIAECEEVFYPVSTYVWCKGESKLLGRHPIFVSSPVRFMSGPNGRFTLFTCQCQSCSVHGSPTQYSEQEIGYQDGYVFRKLSVEPEKPH